MRCQNGFTLIELMLVIAIVGILAAIAIPVYQDYIIRAQVAEGFGLMDGARAAVSEYYTHKGTYPADNAAAGLATDTDIRGSYVTQVDIADGAITATFGGTSINPALADKAVTLTPTTHTGSVGWTCTSASLPQKYLPSTCTGDGD